MIAETILLRTCNYNKSSKSNVLTKFRKKIPREGKINTTPLVTLKSGTGNPKMTVKVYPYALEREKKNQWEMSKSYRNFLRDAIQSQIPGCDLIKM